MNTRREMTAALLGLPLAARAVSTNAEPAVEGTSPPLRLLEQLQELPPFSTQAALIISYTLYGEARGEEFDGKMAVASVIKTRSTLSGKSLAEVCLQSRQFSCWNTLTAVPEFYITGAGIPPADFDARSRCFAIAWMLMVSGQKWDYFTHFYNPDKATPEWAFELRGVRTIGRHVFGFIN